MDKRQPQAGRQSCGPWGWGSPVPGDLSLVWLCIFSLEGVVNRHE